MDDDDIGCFQNEDLKCPYCSNVDTDVFEQSHVYESAESEAKCFSCNKTFHVETSFLFTTKKKEVSDE